MKLVRELRPVPEVLARAVATGALAGLAAGVLDALWSWGAAAQFVPGGDPGFFGNADPWATEKTVELVADGACGWILPDGPASARPMNTAGAPIQLTYAP